MTYKTLDKDVREIEPGRYSFRSRCITAADETEIAYSPEYRVVDIDELKTAQKEYLASMLERGYKQTVIVSILKINYAWET